MGGRSYNCSICSKGFLSGQAVTDHEKACAVRSHDRRTPIKTWHPEKP